MELDAPFGFSLNSSTSHNGMYSGSPGYCEFEVIVVSSVFLLAHVCAVRQHIQLIPKVFQSHPPSRLDAKYNPFLPNLPVLHLSDFAVHQQINRQSPH